MGREKIQYVSLIISQCGCSELLQSLTSSYEAKTTFCFELPFVVLQMDQLLPFVKRKLVQCSLCSYFIDFGFIFE